MRDGTVTLPDGRSLSYGEHGAPDGAPIVYNHPLPGARNFSLDERVLEAAGARAFTLERPAIGRSTRAPGRTLADWPADVDAFADALGLDRFAVLGVSAGGAYALAVAHALGSRVTRVGLACALGPIFDHPEFDPEMPPSFQALLPIARMDPAAAEGLLRQFAAPMSQRFLEDRDAFFEEWVEGWPDDQRPLYEQNRDRWMLGLEATYGDPDAFADDVVAFIRWTFDPAEIKVPVRAWHGTKDGSAPYGLTKLVVERAGGEMVTYEGLGHYLQPDLHAEWVAWLIADATA